jgi:uncharacterized protein (TIGR00255 family)
MTGFARREQRSEVGVLAWEVRSVNHRYLEVALRLPDELRAAEGELRDLVATRLARGKVDANLRRDGSGRSAGLVVDEALAREVASAARRVAAAVGETTPPDALDLLRWPGVANAAPLDPGPLLGAARALLAETLDELLANRRREGDKLAAAIAERARALRELVAAQRARTGELAAALRARLAQRVAELGASVDPQRLEQEVVLLAAKADVAEELDRLDVHLDELAAALASGEPVGRRLDFLLQEFNREANTFGSKAQDPTSTKAAVEMKVLIEQMREQVQNLE